jgi:hypothetical protein
MLNHAYRDIYYWRMLCGCRSIILPKNLANFSQEVATEWLEHNALTESSRVSLSTRKQAIQTKDLRHFLRTWRQCHSTSLDDRILPRVLQSISHRHYTFYAFQV